MATPDEPIDGPIDGPIEEPAGDQPAGVRWRDVLAEDVAKLTEARPAEAGATLELEARRLVEEASGHEGAALAAHLDDDVTVRHLAYHDGMLRRRLAGWLGARLDWFQAPLSRLDGIEASPAVRGLGFQLAESLGLLPRRTVAPLCNALNPGDRAAFHTTIMLSPLHRLRAEPAHQSQ